VDSEEEFAEAMEKMETEVQRNRSLQVVLLGVYKFICFSTSNGAGQKRVQDAERLEHEASKALERTR
jgi:hypothetical protein